MSCNENIAYCNWKLQVKPKHLKNEWFLIRLINTIHEFKIHVQNQSHYSCFLNCRYFLTNICMADSNSLYISHASMGKFHHNRRTDKNWDNAFVPASWCMIREDIQKVYYSILSNIQAKLKLFLDIRVIGVRWRSVLHQGYIELPRSASCAWTRSLRSLCFKCIPGLLANRTSYYLNVRVFKKCASTGDTNISI